MSHRVFKKLVPDLADIDAAIIMVNAVDPQLAMVELFLAAVEDRSCLIILNKADMVEKAVIPELKAKLKGEVITASVIEGRGIPEIEHRLSQWKMGSRILVGGVFNSGKTTLINALTGSDEPTDDIPGTTLEFKEHPYRGMTLIDSLGQIIDVNMPMMVSVDLDGCETVEDKVRRVMEVDARAITESIDSAVPGLVEAVEMLVEMVDGGGKLIVCGAGASALVAKEIAGQAQETGVPVLVFTNDFGSIQPVSFAKGIGEDEASLGEYIALAASPGDCMLGVSASGGTGFVFGALEIARLRGAHTIAITENRDTPLGKAADVVIKSEGKPEGPSSAPVMVAHLAIGHALILAVADERGVDAKTAIEYMLKKVQRNKAIGIK